MTARDHPDPGADMSDRTSAPERERALDDEISQAALEADAPPPRRSARRRLVTPVTAALCGLLLATAGFIAGVQVQKGQADDPSPTAGGAGATGAAARFASGPNAAAGGGPRGGEAPTIGSVANKKGSTLYVEDADGTTVRVKTNAQSKVTRNAAASVRGIYPGDSVIVQGTKDKDGNIVATQITATSKTAAASGGGLRQAFGGGAPPGGGAPSAGGAPRTR
jgi:hypothetical protein